MLLDRKFIMSTSFSQKFSLKSQRDWGRGGLGTECKGLTFENPCPRNKRMGVKYTVRVNNHEETFGLDDTLET